MDNLDTVYLVVNGRKYSSWLSIEIRKSIRSIAGLFTLNITESLNKSKKPWFIIPGDYCELFIGDELMMSGYIDDLSYSVSDKARTITVTGRDKTGDLVDCSIDDPNVTFNNIRLNSLLEKLIKPFKIKLINKTSRNPEVTAITYNTGASVFDVMSDLSKKYGFLATSNEVGDLVIVKVGESRATDTIEEGVNLLNCSITFDHKERFSKYMIKGNDFGSDDANGLHLLASSTDPDIKRHRPKIIKATTDVNEGDLKKRSIWEKNLREGKSTASRVKIKGWRQSNGDLWKFNTIVRFRTKYLGLETDFLIGDVTYSFNDSGRTVELELLRKEVFENEILLSKMKDDAPEKQLQKDFFKNV